jgi:glycosyltransferase involved in cell wall biosynthesis
MTADVVVIVPTFDRAGTIVASVASLLAEHEVRVEVVVVDDGSGDDTLERLRAVEDARLRVLARPHAGIAAARNAGIAASASPFVAFHDSDDLALPGRLARPVRHLATHPEAHFVVQNGRMVAAGDAVGEPWVGARVAARLAARPVTVAEVFRWNLGQLQGMCFRRAALDAVGPFDPSFRILDDLDLVLRVASAYPVAFLDEPAFRYRRHAGGLARDRSTIREEAIRLAEKLVAAHPEVLPLVGRTTFERRQARRYARLARDRLREGDALGARSALTTAKRLRPLNIRYRLEALWLRLRPRS